ncbi:MAG: hypothetical protein Q9195_008551 [Heterodermia aff. obscurata]
MSCINSKGLNFLCTLGVAKDSNASIGTRATAAKDMVSDKIDEHQHAGKEELYSAKK